MKKIISLCLILTMLSSLTACSSVEREVKSFTSDMGGGLNRTVTVYDQAGNKIKEYKGKIDIQDTEYGNKVLFDLDGKRVVIYNGVVITEEVAE